MPEWLWPSAVTPYVNAAPKPSPITATPAIAAAKRTGHMGQHLLEADYVRLFPAELFQNQGLAEAKIIRAVLPKIAADVKGGASQAQRGASRAPGEHWIQYIFAESGYI